MTTGSITRVLIRKLRVALPGMVDHEEGATLGDILSAENSGGGSLMSIYILTCQRFQSIEHKKVALVLKQHHPSCPAKLTAIEQTPFILSWCDHLEALWRCTVKDRQLRLELLYRGVPLDETDPSGC